MGSAGFGEHLAQHGAEADDQGEVAERFGQAGAEAFRDLRGFHARGQAEEQGDEREREDGVELDPRDEQDQPGNREGGNEEQGVRGENREREKHGALCIAARGAAANYFFARRSRESRRAINRGLKVLVGVQAFLGREVLGTLGQLAGVFGLGNLLAGGSPLGRGLHLPVVDGVVDFARGDEARRGGQRRRERGSDGRFFPRRRSGGGRWVAPEGEKACRLGGGGRFVVQPRDLPRMFLCFQGEEIFPRASFSSWRTRAACLSSGVTAQAVRRMAQANGERYFIAAR